MTESTFFFIMGKYTCCQPSKGVINYYLSLRTNACLAASVLKKEVDIGMDFHYNKILFDKS